MFIANLILTVVLATAPTLKLDTVTLKNGDKYDIHRADIARNGWHPVGAKKRQEGDCIYAACEIYPEMKDSSGTGEGFATMIWKNDDGRVLTIITAESGDETIVHSIEIKAKK